MKINKNTNYHHGDLKRALMDASLEVINKHGVAYLNLRKLAIHIGVSSGAPYHHFADRSELLTAIAKEGFELLELSMNKECESVIKDPSAKLEALGRAYIMFAISHPGHFKVMFRGDVNDKPNSESSKSGQRTFQLLCEAIQECQVSGSAPKGDPEPLVLHAWVTVHGLSSLLVDGSLKQKISIDPDKLPSLVTGLSSQMFKALAGVENSNSNYPKLRKNVLKKNTHQINLSTKIKN